MYFGSSGRPAVDNKINPFNGSVQVYNGRTYTQEPAESLADKAAELGGALKKGSEAAGVMPGGGGGSSVPLPSIPPIGGGGPGSGSMPQVPGVGMQSGTDAAMLRAKDRIGLASRGALEGLRATLGERGILGSGVEGRQTERIAQSGLEQLADTSREQAIKESDQAQHNAELAYQGQITQRGQDITQRGQDLNAQLAREGRFQSTQQQLQDAILSALKGQLY